MEIDGFAFYRARLRFERDRRRDAVQAMALDNDTAQMESCLFYRFAALVPGDCEPQAPGGAGFTAQQELKTNEEQYGCLASSPLLSAGSAGNEP